MQLHPSSSIQTKNPTNVGLDYTQDAKDGRLGVYKSDADIKDDMTEWSLEDFQVFYGFTHRGEL